MAAMRSAAVLVALGVGLTLTRGVRAEPDPWFGRDKALHFGVSVVLGGGGYAASAPLFDERWQRALAGASFSLSLGAAKELHDLSGAGNASWKDFAWDVAGTGVGVGIALLIDLALSADARSRDAVWRGPAEVPCGMPPRNDVRWRAMTILDGKVCVITGAGHGIGRATALLFAREGASVVVNDVGGPRDGTSSDATVAERVVEEIRAAGGKAVANHDSVARREGAEGIVQTAVRELGRLDAIVNNAGILRDKTLLKMDDAMWDAVIDVHLRGTFLCTQAAARQFREQGSPGRIVNTTSVSGMLGNFGQTNYSAAKAGIYGITRTASIELQRHQITVNAVAPIAKTRMTEDLPMFEKLDTLTPEHVAPAHLFLSSDLCGDLTGAVLAVAGGKMSIYKVVESAGKYKESDGGVWTAHEIAEHWDAISKL